VYVIPFKIQTNSIPGDKPVQGESQDKILLPPSKEELNRLYSQLSREYDTIFMLTISSLLNPVIRVALSASLEDNKHATIIVMDSQTTGIGLGLLVQAAAAAASRGSQAEEIEKMIRKCIPRIYMLLCIPELTYLAHSGYIEYSQALVGEMMGMLPIFTLEEGRLTPMEKVRTPRHLYESFLEFINEFDSPAHIAFMRGASQISTRTRPIRQYVQETFPHTPYTEHVMSPHLAALFGSQSMALVIMDKQDQGV
jgi:DegV family protein with EDD domain